MFADHIIRNIDEVLTSQLRACAAKPSASMEVEAEDILRAIRSNAPFHYSDLGAAIRDRFAPLGGVDLSDPAREPIRDPAERRG